MPRSTDPFAPAIATSRRWLVEIAEELATDDLDAAYRAIRSWLHLVRDQLPVDDAAHFSAQLPEFFRGLFFEGWRPSAGPARYDRTTFVHRFSHETGVLPESAAIVIRDLSQALDQHMSGHLAAILPHFPNDVRDLLTPRRPAPLHELAGW